MIHVLLDTNVLLDVLLMRNPWVNQAAAILQASDEGQIRCYVTASTITDVFYIARRARDLDSAREAVRTCLEVFEICTVDRYALEQAQEIINNDFEDNPQVACAMINQLDVIITRDGTGFQASPIQVLSPDEFLASLR